MPKDLPSPELLRKLLRYEPKTGKLFWLFRGRSFFKRNADWITWNKRFAGKEALTAYCNSVNKYKHGHVLGVKIKAHRVAWAIYYAEWPKQEIDHINGHAADNRIKNLRLASRLENNKNLARPKTNTSGVVGVSWSRERKKWVAQVSEKNKTVPLGRFDCFWHAVLARREANVRMKFHKNHGKRLRFDCAC